MIWFWNVRPGIPTTSWAKSRILARPKWRSIARVIRLSDCCIINVNALSRVVVWALTATSLVGSGHTSLGFPVGDGTPGYVHQVIGAFSAAVPWNTRDWA